MIELDRVEAAKYGTKMATATCRAARMLTTRRLWKRFRMAISNSPTAMPPRIATGIVTSSWWWYQTGDTCESRRKPARAQAMRYSPVKRPCRMTYTLPMTARKTAGSDSLRYPAIVMGLLNSVDWAAQWVTVSWERPSR